MRRLMVAIWYRLFYALKEAVPCALLVWPNIAVSIGAEELIGLPAICIPMVRTPFAATITFAPHVVFLRVCTVLDDQMFCAVSPAY